MEIIRLNETYLAKFKKYCLTHRSEHDDTFLTDSDIEHFQINNSSPTNILIENDQIIGVISLILNRYYLVESQCRIRIFHCIKDSFTQYKNLFDSMGHDIANVSKIEIFIPESKTQILEYLKKMNFKYLRTSFVMKYKMNHLFDIEINEKYKLKPFVHSQDEDHYMEIRNSAFASIEGSKTPISKQEVIELVTDSTLIKDGVQLLWNENRAIGLIRMLIEEEDNILHNFISPIAILPDYQGKGIGYQMLKMGLNIGYHQDLNHSMLVVNGENEDAIKLYKKIGYKKEMAYVCLNNHLK
ncbi:MAG: GNAT family N-acetyltransferase [Acholeplasmataceae bacterium]|nr:GNAT family N-acetyltransferase [Acholeplasmataceae bacterium]